jgi:Zn-dependent protease
METIFLLAVLIFSIIIHEVAHAAMADSLGDRTARFAGRLTFNPIKHFDFVGSFLVPLLCFVLPTRFIFGWAKPVPINPYNFKDQKYGSLKVALSGPGSNLLVAVFFGIIGRFLLVNRTVVYDAFSVFLRDFRIPEALGFFSFSETMFFFFLIIIFINVVLAMINLMPIPPLDGSHVLFTFLPRLETKFREISSRGGILVLPLIILVIYYVLPVVFLLAFSLFRLIAGV